MANLIDLEEGKCYEYMQQRVSGKRSEMHNFTIFRIPENIRKSKAHLFEPAVISIGPYHHQSRPNLRAMEEMKWQVLRNILNQHGGAGALAICINAIKKLEGRARRCYDEIIDMNSDSFVQMMVLDGCFVLAYLCDLSGQRSKIEHSIGWSYKMIRHDLILMENQIPFFILDALHHCFKGEHIVPKKQIADILVGEMTPNKIPSGPINIDHTHFDHLLHLCHHFIVGNKSGHEPPIKPKEKTQHRNLFKNIIKPSLNQSTVHLGVGSHNSDHVGSVSSIPCATELEEAGVKFRRKEKGDFTDVTFHAGVLEIPSLQIDDLLVPRLLSLIAFEQCKLRPGLISSYVAFMDSIVNTTSDVMILQRKRIFDNMLSSEEETAILFNQTSQYVFLDKDHFFAELFKEVNQYCEAKKHRYRANLMHKYFSSPWSILSLLAAIILLLLASAQTFYTIIAYYHDPHAQ